MKMNMRNENRLVPKLRFKEFVEEWNPEKLSNILDYERPDNYIVKDTNYLKAGTAVLTANKSFILGYTQETEGICNDIPVIIFDDFTVDNKYVNFPFKVKSSAIKILRPRGKDNLKFIFELMSLIQYDANEHKRYYISAYQNLTVLIPKIPEQQKIASCLSSLDEVITGEKQKLELLKAHKKGLLQQLFPQEGETVPKLRFKEFEESGEWEVKRLNEIGEFTGGGTPSKSNESFWIGDIPWISSSDIEEESIHSVKVNRYISKEALISSATKIVSANSILLVSRVGVGKLAITLTPICTSQDFTNFTPTKENLIFLAYCLKNQKGNLLGFSQGMAIKGFTKDDISNLDVAIPSINEQEKIAACLSSLDDLLTAQVQKLSALKQHKKALLQGLFPTINKENE